MDRKKVIIISLVVAGTFVFVMVAFLKNKGLNGAAPVVTAPVGNNPVSNNLPTQNSNNPTNNPTNPTKNPLDTFSSNVINVNDPNDSTEVKSAFGKFTATGPTHPIEWTNIEDNNKNSVTLDEFSKAINLNVNQSLYKVLNANDFDLFSCPSSEGSVKNIGINFTLKLLPNYNGDLYTDETIFMKNWEKTMLQDVAPIIFPGVNFSSQQLQQPLIFSDAKYQYAQERSAAVVLPDGTKSSITYDIVDDYVIISNSPQCVDNADYQLFTPDD